MYYMITLTACPNGKVRLIKLIRSTFNMHLADAKDFVERCAVTIDCAQIQFQKDFESTQALLPACDADPHIAIEINTIQQEWKVVDQDTENTFWYDNFMDVVAQHGDRRLMVTNIFQDRTFEFLPYA